MTIGTARGRSSTVRLLTPSSTPVYFGSEEYISFNKPKVTPRSTDNTNSLLWYSEIYG